MFLRSKAARVLLYPAILVRRLIMRRRNTLRYTFVARLQECLAEDPVVHIDEFQGVFELDRRSHLFARIVSEGTYEPELAHACFANLDPSRDAIDIGANAGFYTNLM